MAVGIVAATAVSVAVGHLVVDGFDGSLDRAELDVVEALERARRPVLDVVTTVGVLLADVVTVSVLWLAATLVALWRTGRLLLPAFLLVAIGGENVTYLVTAAVVGRPRPPVEPLGHVFATSSFPSGHVSSAVTLYGSLAVVACWCSAQRSGAAPRALVAGSTALVAAIVVLVGFSRVYRGQHYPSDVVWGAVLGCVWLAGARRAVLGRRQLIDEQAGSR